ncbi:MAG: tetratricopeptide repeat protein [Gemmatimonadetes bacterium]|nr:tetratricopeptide repeat protein [Gemmatimonadota bacterium]
MRLFAPLLLVLMATAGCSILGGGGGRIDADDATARGFTLLEEGQYSYAMGAFHDALEKEPEHARARYGLGLVFIETGYVDGAEREFKQAVSLDPSFGDAYLGLGRLYYKLGRPVESEENILLASRHGAGESPQAHYLLGLFAQERESEWEAETHFRNALREEPENAEFRLALVDLLRERGRYDEALAELEREKFARGNDTELRMRFADCRLHVGQDLEAERLYREIMQRNRDRIEPLWGLTVLALRRNDFEEAGKLLADYAAKIDDAREAELFRALSSSLLTPDASFAFADLCREAREDANDDLAARLDELIAAIQSEDSE